MLPKLLLSLLLLWLQMRVGAAPAGQKTSYSKYCLQSCCQYALLYVHDEKQRLV